MRQGRGDDGGLRTGRAGRHPREHVGETAAGCGEQPGDGQVPDDEHGCVLPVLGRGVLPYRVAAPAR
jgi:hypothetical protein